MAEEEKKKMKLLMKEKVDSGSQIDWMYKGEKPDTEEYLLGKRLDRHVEKEEEKTKEDGIGALFGERIKANIAMDMQAKMREDPLFAIRKQEEESRRRILQNPVKMKRLQKLAQQKEKKDKHKHKKSKKKHKHHRKTDSESEDDELMSKYLSILSNMNDQKRKGGVVSRGDRENPSNSGNRSTNDDSSKLHQNRSIHNTDRNKRQQTSQRKKTYSDSESETDSKNKQHRKCRNEAYENRPFQSRNTDWKYEDCDNKNTTHGKHRRREYNDDDNNINSEKCLVKSIRNDNRNYHRYSSEDSHPHSKYRDRRNVNFSKVNKRSDSDSDVRRSEDKSCTRNRHGSDDASVNKARTRKRHDTMSSDEMSRDKSVSRKRAGSNRVSINMSRSKKRHDSSSDGSVDRSQTKKRCGSDDMSVQKSLDRKGRSNCDTSQSKSHTRKRHDSSSDGSVDRSQARKRRGSDDMSVQKSRNDRNQRSSNNMLQNKTHTRKRHDSSSDSELDTLLKKRKQEPSDSCSLQKNGESDDSSSESDEGGLETFKQHGQNERPMKKMYGLVRMGDDRDTPPHRHKAHQGRPREDSRAVSPMGKAPPGKLQSKHGSKSPSPVRKEPKRKMTEEEKQRRLQEMMDNATWRESQRKQNVKQYKDDEQRERELQLKNKGKGNFIGSLMTQHVEKSSVADRIKRNKYNIQRNMDLDKNFTKQ